MAGTVADLMTWAAYEASLKEYLGISGSAEDFSLQLWLEATTEALTLLLESQEFATLPRPIELCVYQAISIWRERQGSDGLASAKTNELAEVYAKSMASDAVFATLRWVLQLYNDGESCLLMGKRARFA